MALFIFGMLTRNGLLAGDVDVTKEDSFFPMNEWDRRNMKVMLTASSRVINWSWITFRQRIVFILCSQIGKDLPDLLTASNFPPPGFYRLESFLQCIFVLPLDYLRRMCFLLSPILTTDWDPKPPQVSKRQTRQTTIPPDRLMDTSVFLISNRCWWCHQCDGCQSVFCILLQSFSSCPAVARKIDFTPIATHPPREIILFPLDNVTLQQKTKRSMPTHFLKFVLFVFQLDFLLLSPALEWKQSKWRFATASLTKWNCVDWIWLVSM